jgi:poly(3-hydroxybutyrate) depolymerase
VASVVLAGLVLGLAASSAVAERPKLETGKILKRTYFFKLAKQEMEYGLYLPRSYDKARAHPLVVALHGLHGSPRRILRYPGLLAQAEKHGCVVVAPMGYNRRGWYGSRGVESGGRPAAEPRRAEREGRHERAGHHAPGRERRSEADLPDGALDGGWRGAAPRLKYPQLWAALAPIAPAILRKPDELEKIKTMPVIVVHGDADRLVSVKISRAWVAKMKALKMDHEYIEVAGGGHVKVAFDNQPAIFAFLLARQRKVPAPAEPVGTDGSERPSEPSRPR